MVDRGRASFDAIRDGLKDTTPRRDGYHLSDHRVPARAMTIPGKAPTSNELAQERTDLAETRTRLADERTKLAVTRTIVALDRTLMAWIRTATSLISFGFTIYKFFQGLNEEDAAGRLMSPRGVGLVMIGLGVGGLVMAIIEYRRQMRDLQTTFSAYGPFHRSVGPAVATVISGLGILGFVLVLLRQ
jgi:putative membrane protein